MKYYIIEDGRLAAVCPTLDSAELLIQIRSQHRQNVADTSVIRGEEELVPYPGKRRHRAPASEAPQVQVDTNASLGCHRAAAGEAPESAKPAKRMPYFLLKDGHIFATVSSKSAAIATIRAYQRNETHYMLRSSFSYIHGVPEEGIDIPA